MFRLLSFPADDGDCFVVCYGVQETPRYVLVDGGRASTYLGLREYLARLGAGGGRLELVVLSHIDADHIEGLIKLAEDRTSPIQIDEVWFNGFDQMASLEMMGPKQGDRFSRALKKCQWKWNGRFSDKMVRVNDNGTARNVTLNGGLSLTIVSPSIDKLRVMRRDWKEWRDGEEKKHQQKKTPAPDGLEVLGRRPMPSILSVENLAATDDYFDKTPPNGSSIALIAAWEDKRVLLAADAHPDQMTDVLKSLTAGDRQRYRIDLFKVAHHGSINNTTRELVELLDCARFLISTSGTRHGHPDPEAVAKLIHYSPSGSKKTLYFNYRQPRSTPWNQTKLKNDHDYDCVFPSPKGGPLIIDV